MKTISILVAIAPLFAAIPIAAQWNYTPYIEGGLDQALRFLEEPEREGLQSVRILRRYKDSANRYTEPVLFRKKEYNREGRKIAEEGFLWPALEQWDYERRRLVYDSLGRIVHVERTLQVVPGGIYSKEWGQYHDTSAFDFTYDTYGRLATVSERGSDPWCYEYRSNGKIDRIRQSSQCGSTTLRMYEHIYSKTGMLDSMRFINLELRDKDTVLMTYRYGPKDSLVQINIYNSRPEETRFIIDRDSDGFALTESMYYRYRTVEDKYRWLGCHVYLYSEGQLSEERIYRSYEGSDSSGPMDLWLFMVHYSKHGMPTDQTFFFNGKERWKEEYQYTYWK